MEAGEDATEDGLEEADWCVCVIPLARHASVELPAEMVPLLSIELLQDNVLVALRGSLRCPALGGRMECLRTVGQEVTVLEKWHRRLATLVVSPFCLCCLPVMLPTAYAYFLWMRNKAVAAMVAECAAATDLCDGRVQFHLVEERPDLKTGKSRNPKGLQTLFKLELRCLANAELEDGAPEPSGVLISGSPPSSPRAHKGQAAGGGGLGTGHSSDDSEEEASDRDRYGGVGRGGGSELRRAPHRAAVEGVDLGLEASEDDITTDEGKGATDQETSDEATSEEDITTDEGEGGSDQDTGDDTADEVAANGGTARVGAVCVFGPPQLIVAARAQGTSTLECYTLGDQVVQYDLM